MTNSAAVPHVSAGGCVAGARLPGIRDVPLLDCPGRFPPPAAGAIFQAGTMDNAKYVDDRLKWLMAILVAYVISLAIIGAIVWKWVIG